MSSYWLPHPLHIRFYYVLENVAAAMSADQGGPQMEQGRCRVFRPCPLYFILLDQLTWSLLQFTLFCYLYVGEVAAGSSSGPIQIVFPK